MGSWRWRGLTKDSTLIRRRVRLVITGSLLGLTAAATSAHADPVKQPPAACERIAFSPEFETDGTAFCVTRSSSFAGAEDPAFSVTSDGGRSWRRTPAEGLVLDQFDGIGQLLVSPLFSEDGAVYLANQRGLWRSADSGETFELAYSISLLHNPEGLTPFVTPGAPPAGRTPAFALANYDYSGVITPPLVVPAAGSPVDDFRFLVPPGDVNAQEALVIGYRTVLGEPPAGGGPADSDVFTTVFQCTPGFTCELPLFEFPADRFPHDAWYGADGETIYVALGGWLDSKKHRELWMSEDGGASFRPWKSVNRLLKPINRVEGFEPGVGLAVHPSFPERMYLRVSYGMGGVEDPPTAPPGDQIFRSNDGGRSWKRVAFGWYGGQDRAGGNIPWGSRNAISPAGKIWMEADGRLFVIGTDLEDGYEGVYCSTNRGRTWAKLCAK